MRGQPSQTAEAVCWMRASERRRPPAARIIDDPYAALFLGPVLRAALATWDARGALGTLADRFSPGLVTWVLCRHRFMDERLITSLASPVEQVVILGAGYDTRAYRLAHELEVRPVFEVDHPATSRRKAKIIAAQRGTLPTADVRTVEIDFERDSLRERLQQAGFERGLRTFFVWEGVAMYLTREAVKATLVELREISAPGSEVVLDLWALPDGTDLGSAAHRLSASALQLIGEPLRFEIHPEDGTALLERLGYRVADSCDAAELRKRYVRDGRRVYEAGYVVRATTARPRPAKRRGAPAAEEELP